MLQLFTFPFSAMASPCAVHLYGYDRARVEAIAEAAITEVARIEQRYSRYCSGSVLAEINDVAQRAGSIVVCTENLIFIV
jgi:thiamine biosynthesis lipoprotein